MPRTDLPAAVAEALAKADTAALQALSQSPDRELKKAAKRALHLLRAKGVDVPEPAREAAPTPKLAPEEQPEPLRLTSFDGAGERAIFLPFKAPTGFTLHVAIVSDEGVLLDLRAHALSRKQLKAYFAGLPAETRAELREVTPARVARLLGPALAASGGPLRPSAKALLAQLPDPEPAPAPSAPTEAGRLAESAELFKQALFARSLPEREAILALSQKLEEVAVSPLYVDEQQRLAQLQRTVEGAVTAYFTPERREGFAARATDAAEVFELRGEDEAAARAAALAQAFASDRDVLTIPFARAFFERILNLEAASKIGPPEAQDAPQPQPEPQSPLIIAP